MTGKIAINQSPLLVHTSDPTVLDRALTALTQPIIHIDDPDMIIERAKAVAAALVIVDDLALCEALSGTISVPILVLTDDPSAAMAVGASDCSPIHPILLQRRVTSLLQETYAAYDSIPTMLYITDADNRIVYITPFFLDTLGYTRDEVIGKQIREFMSETSRHVAPKLIERFRETGTSLPLAFRYRKRNGREIDAITDFQRTAHGHILATLRDISELQAAEKTIHNSRKVLDSVLSTLPEIILVFSKSGTLLAIISDDPSEHSIDYLQYVGHDITEIFPQDVASPLLASIQKTIATNTTDSLDIEMQQEDGQNTSYQATASPINQHEGVLVLRDVTERRDIERTLEESEQKYRRLFENATDAIFVVDVMTGDIMETSPQASLMLGYSHDELTSMQIDEIESDQIAIQDDEHDFDVTNKLTVETKYKRHDGSLIDVEINSRVIMQNHQLILISFVRDISERKQALDDVEQQRNIAQALLETANTLNHVDQLDDILMEILTQIDSIIPCNSANVMLIRNSATHIVSQIGYEAVGFQPEDIAKIVLPLNKTSNLDWIIANKKPSNVSDTQNSPHFNWVDPTTKNYIRSILTAPIIINGTVIGFINLDSADVDNFTKDHEAQLMAFANQAAIAIRRANMIQELEERVQERTQDLLTANAALRATQDQLATERNLLRSIIDTIPSAIYVKDINHRFIIANQATVIAINGVEKEEDLIGKTDHDFYPVIAEQLKQEELAIMSTGMERRNKSEVYHNLDGTVTHLLVTKMPLVDASNKIVGLIGVNTDITQLKEAEARLEQVINSARCLLWSAAVIREDEAVPFDWQYEIANEQAAQDFLSLSHESGRFADAWLNAIPEQYRKERSKAFTAAIQYKRDAFQLEYPLVVDGETQYWLSEEVLIDQVDEKIWRAVGVATDITVRKEVEAQLKDLNEDLEVRVISRTLDLSKANTRLLTQIEDTERAEASERQQRIIADALRDGIAQLATTPDLESIFDYLLNLMKSIIPHDASSIALIEDHDFVIVHSVGYDGKNIGFRIPIVELPDVQEIIREKSVFLISNVEEYSDWKDEEHAHWVKSNLAIPIMIEGQVIGTINLDSQHINNFDLEHKDWLVTFGEQVGLAIRNARYMTNLEEIVSQRTQELEFEQAQLRAILNGVTDGVVYTDIDRKPQYINQAMMGITGFTEAEFQNGEAQKVINSYGDSSIIDTNWSRIIRWLKNNDLWTGEYKLVRKDGSLFDAHIARTLVKGQQGEPVGIVTSIRDISDEKVLAEQKARFITKAAHELRTPIANMKTRLFLMKRRPDKLAEHIKVAEDVTNLMQNLVEHMFDLTRFERGIMELDKEAIVLNGFLEDVLQFQKPQAERMNISVMLQVPDAPVTIYGDPYRLTQVITNLLGNALKHTPSGKNLHIKMTVDAPYVQIDVADQGSGIAKEHLPNLFQPFYQATEDQSGVGLGLAIVQEIVRAHDGEITVDSIIGHGTTFHVRLPLKPSTDTQDT